MTDGGGPRIAGVHAVLPPHRYPQQQITDAFAELCLGPGGSGELARRLHASAQVGFRNLALPLADYWELDGFTAANDAFCRVGVELAAEAVTGALADAGVAAEQVDLIASTTVTGIAVPSIEARLAAPVGLRPDVARVPLFGLGCVAGAAGIARLHDYLVGHPDAVAVLVSVELCSLTIQRDDRSVANLVATGLFGDGAAAVVMLGARRAAELGANGPTTVDTVAHLYPDSHRTMGWDVGSSGLKIVLGAEVPDMVRRYLAADVQALLARHDLRSADVATWVAHPGGPKVIMAMESELGLRPDAMELTWRSLADVGNLSSSSVLHVLRDTMDKRTPTPGSSGIILAMGPGFCAELVLIEW